MSKGEFMKDNETQEFYVWEAGRGSPNDSKFYYFPRIDTPEKAADHFAESEWLSYSPMISSAHEMSHSREVTVKVLHNEVIHTFKYEFQTSYRKL